MRKELASLYKLKASLARDFEAATRAMPEKNAIDYIAGLIAILENQQRPQARLESDKVIRLPSKKPRTLVSGKEKTAILDWLQEYFSRKNNQPAGFRRLTELMLADGIKIPGSPQTQIFVVSGLVTRNKMFKGRNGLWHLAEFAA
jgi:hypothetical protein